MHGSNTFTLTEHLIEPVLTFAPSYIVPGLGDFGDRFYTM